MLKLPSKPTAIKSVENFVSQVAIKYDIQPDKFPNILISLTEAVNNAILHGNKRDQEKFVDIQLKETSKGLCFEVTDEGAGFNPKSIPDPTLEENLDCCGGRGVFLMKELSDEINFIRNGRCVALHFNL